MVKALILGLPLRRLLAWLTNFPALFPARIALPDPLRDFAYSCLSGLEVLARVEAAVAAAKVPLIAAYAEAAEALTPPPAHGSGVGFGAGRRSGGGVSAEMCVVTEVACVLTIGERAASALLCEARTLTGSLPVVLGSLQAGTISWQHARAMINETTGLTPDAITAVTTRFFGPHTAADTGAGADADPAPDAGADADPAPDAGASAGIVPDACVGAGVGGVLVSRFRRKVRDWRERHHPESFEARHVRSVADRRVEFGPDRDGMGWISLYFPAVTASAVWNKTTALARGLQSPHEHRTLTQLRADVTADLLLTTHHDHPRTRDGSGAGLDAGTGPVGAGAGPGFGGGVGSGVRADVLVTVPVLSLLGITEEPAELDGYGPIPPSIARRLVADNTHTLYRVLVVPRNGTPLELGRTTYRIPPSLKRWLRLRDGGCTFPGCSNHTPDNDTDHLTPWHHHHHQPRTTLPQSPPPQTPHPMDPHPSNHHHPTQLDLTHRPPLLNRTTTPRTNPPPTPTTPQRAKRAPGPLGER